MTLVPVRAQFLLPDGSPVEGEVTFSPRARARDTLTGVFYLSEVTFVLDGDGYLGGVAGVTLQALDDPGMVPNAWYVVTFHLRNAQMLKGSLRIYIVDAGPGVELAARIQFS